MIGKQVRRPEASIERDIPDYDSSINYKKQRNQEQVKNIEEMKVHTCSSMLKMCWESRGRSRKKAN